MLLTQYMRWNIRNHGSQDLKTTENPTMQFPYPRNQMWNTPIPWKPWPSQPTYQQTWKQGCRGSPYDGMTTFPYPPMEKLPILQPFPQ